MLCTNFANAHAILCRMMERWCGKTYWKKQSIRYYFAYSQKRRKLIGNKKVGIIRNEVFV